MNIQKHAKFGTNWDSEDDAVLREHYATKGARWCSEHMPWRSVSAVRSRAHVIKCAPNKAMRAIATRERREARADAGEVRKTAWTPPGPRYPSVWAMAQGVTA